MTSVNGCAILNSTNEREVNTMKLSMTYHAREERFDRLSALVDYLGVGEIVLEVPDKYYTNSISCLTSTGIIIVKSSVNGVMITGYMASIRQATAMFYTAGISRIPRTLYQTINRNNKKYSFLAEL